MKFLHSMIRTNNEKEMIKFYTELLGLKIGQRIRLEDCYLQYLKDEITNTELELTINDESPDKYLQGEQFGHFAFECDDLDETDEKITSLGYKWYVEPFYLEQVKTRISFIKDPDGNEVELIEKK